MAARRSSSWGGAVVLVITTASVASASQLQAIPYDAAAVRRTAENIFIEIANVEHGLPGDRDEGAKLEFIVRSLSGLTDLSVVERRVLDALITQAGTGRMAVGAIARFGDRAVAPLIASARTTSPNGSSARDGALRCLTELTGNPNGPSPLTSGSKASIAALAHDILTAPRVSFVELRSAAVLAIATGDPALRAAAARLADPSELHARGIDDVAQRMVIRSITDALAKYPAR